MENRLIPYVATTSFGMGRVLVLAPHPDDEVFGCGGAILRQVAEGGVVQVVVVTDGDHQPDQTDTQEYCRTRRAESHQAAQALGYGAPVFWGLKDRGLEYGEQLVQRIADQINTFAPDGVFAPSVHEMHPDHRALGMAALEAVRRHGSTLKLVMYEVGVPMPRPNVLLDISSLADRKQLAMACFVSQLQGQAYDQQIRALNCFRTYTLGTQVTAAEAYLVVQPSELQCDSLELYESEYQRQRSLGLPMVPSDLPLVSVIVRGPVGLVPQSALDSIALQTYPHVEVIMLSADGAAPGMTPLACGRFPLRQIQAPHTAGPAAWANASMNGANGQYLIFLEADGLFLPDHLEKLVRSLAESDALAAYTGVKFVDKQGQSIAVLDEAWNIDRLRGENYLPANSVLFARSLVEKGCQFQEVLGHLDGWGFWLQVAAHTTFQHAPKVSAVCRSTGASLGRLAENQRLQAALQDTQESLSNTNLQLAANQTRAQELEAQLYRLRSQMDQLGASVTAQTARVHSLESTVQQFASSTSWKITGPLRFLSTLLRGRR
ncbi:MAG: PIG-L family deacetylase [Pseudomonadota bacterium]